MIFNFARRARKIALYSDLTHSFDWKSAVEHDGVFKMRDSVPSTRYSSVCNVLRQRNIQLIPILIESTDSIIHASLHAAGQYSVGPQEDSVPAWRTGVCSQHHRGLCTPLLPQ